MNLEHFAEPDRKKAILAMLVETVKSDGAISPIELKYLNYVAEKMAINQTDVLAVMENPSMYPLTPPAAEDERMTILYLILFAMQADKNIDDTEVNLSYKYALKLGVRPETTQNLIDVMQNFAKKEMPPGAMLTEIKKYLN